MTVAPESTLDAYEALRAAVLRAEPGAGPDLGTLRREGLAAWLKGLIPAPGGSAWPGNATAASEHRRSPRVVDRRQLPDGDAQASVIGAAAEANRHEAAL